MADLNALYEQYLGRAPDPSGIATWSGQDEASIIAGILGSQEYQNNQANGGGGGSSAPAADSGYNINPNNLSQGATNVIPQGQFIGNGDNATYGTLYTYSNGATAVADPQTGALLYVTPPTSQYSLNNQGYLSSNANNTFANIGGQNVQVQAPNLIAGNNGQPSTINGVPVQRGINGDAGFLQNVMSYVTPALAAAPWLYAAGSALGGGAATGAEAMGPTYSELGYTPFSAPSGGLTAAEMAAGSGNPATSGVPLGQAFTNAEIAAGTGNPLTSGLASSDVWGPTYAELGYTGAGTPETAAAIAAADAASAAAASSLPSWLSDLAKAIPTGGGSGLAGLLRQGAGSGLASSLGKLATGQTGYGMEIPGIVRTNQNPFVQSQNFEVSSKTPDLASIAKLLKQG